MRLEFILRRAKRYGDTKRGPYSLRFFSGEGVRVEVSDGELTTTGLMTYAEIGRLKTDEAIAKLCHVIDETIHELRELVRKRR